MPEELEPYPWPPGAVELVPDHDKPTRCVVYDGAGNYCAMFRVGKTTLQFTTRKPDEGISEGSWKDATARWPFFPPWVRRQVIDALHAVF